MKLKTILSYLFLLIIFLVAHENSEASSRISNPRALGLAGGYMALAKGVESPHWNPANLALPQQRFFSMNFLSLGVGINNNSFSKSQYDRYNGAHLTNEDLESLLASIPDDGLDIDLLANTEFLGFAYGNYAFTISGVAGARATIAKDLPALLPGNDLDRIYDLSNCNGIGWSYIAYGLSGAMPLNVQGVERFSVGATIRYLQGLYGGNVDNFTGTVQTSESYLYSQANGAYNYAKGGNGFSIDLGAAAKINRKWTIGLAFNNLLNTISWKRNAERTDFVMARDSLNLYEITQIDDQDSLFVIEDTTSSINSFSTKLPEQMRIGAAYFGGQYTITADYVQGFRDGPGVSKIPQLATGLEFIPIYWFPLRIGFAVGGQETLQSAFGFGFNFRTIKIDFAATNQGSLLPGNRQGSTLAFGIRFIPDF